MLALNFVLILLGIAGIIIVNSENYSQIQVLSAKNMTSQNFFQYFPLFALFALAFELQFISMAVIYVLVLAMLCAVYVKNDLIRINPFLNIVGFSTFEVTYKKGEEVKTDFMFSLCPISTGKNYSNGFFVKRKLRKR